MTFHHAKPSSGSKTIAQVTAFRQEVHQCLGSQADSLFELCDALLVSPPVSSFVELTLSPVFRRKWCSAYKALKLGKMHRASLQRHLFAFAPQAERPIWAIDHTSWIRPYSPTLPDRGFHHHPTPVPGGKPVGIGHAYSTLSLIPEAEGSWALPLDNQRVPTRIKPTQMGLTQIKTAIRQTTKRPLVVGDSEYGTAPFVQEIDTIEADFLLRIRPNRIFRGPPPAYSGRGRPPIHGIRFSLKDPQTWPEPDTVFRTTDQKLGQVVVQSWKEMHFREVANQQGILIRVHRPDARNTRRDPQDLWMFYIATTQPDLAQIWKDYLRRFAIEHFYRFVKQTLMWTAPRLKTLKAAQRWTDIVTLAYWQLWLARPILEDCPLPWQKSLQLLTPGRALRAIGSILMQIGTPARMPKPRGKSPGRAEGQSPGRYRRYKVVKKPPRRY